MTISNISVDGLESSAKDFEVQKALALSACPRLRRIWKSILKRGIKERLFMSSVESILLYGSETWTVTKAMEEKLDGCYTKMLRMVFNVSWQDKLTNKELYGNLPPASSKVGFRMLKLAGHCVRHPEEEASKLLLWQPRSECMNMGKSSVTYIDILKSDTSLESAEELRTPMLDRETWKRRAKSRRALARP